MARFSYSGADFFGVQHQPGLKTVLGALKNRIEIAAKQPPRALSIASRTDRGVHALQNFATFWLKAPFSETLFKKEVESTEFLDNLFNLVVSLVPISVHARGSSKSKVYRYIIKDGFLEPDLGSALDYWPIFPRLDISKMQVGANYLIGSHDFSSFRGAGCGAKSSVKEIYSILITRVGFEEVHIEIMGNSFLRKMVRNIVGLLVEMGAGLRDPCLMPQILEQKSRSAAGVMAPPYGLTLIKVNFEY